MKSKAPRKPAKARTASRPCTAPEPTIAAAAAGPGRRRAELEAKRTADTKRDPEIARRARTKAKIKKVEIGADDHAASVFRAYADAPDEWPVRLHKAMLNDAKNELMRDAERASSDAAAMYEKLEEAKAKAKKTTPSEEFITEVLTASKAGDIAADKYSLKVDRIIARELALVGIVK